MKKEEAQTILDCYEKLEKNLLPTDLINKAYSLLPNVTEQTFQRVKVQQIRRYVTFNKEVLDEALEEIVSEPIENYDQMNSDDIIAQIENEIYDDLTPEDMRTEIDVHQSTTPPKAKGTVGRPKGTSTGKTKIVRKKK